MCRNEAELLYTLLDMEAMEQAGILRVQNFPTLELQGSGVLIGFVDTGIDYTNSIFRKLDGSTRIVGIWDQVIQDGPAPGQMNYGTEYTEEQINEALNNEKPFGLVKSRDEVSHGSFLASLAAGSANVENQFIGAAPDASIAMVKLREAERSLKEYYLVSTDAPCYQERDIINGVKYLDDLADSLGLPLVICIALGTNLGSHAASSPLCGVLEVVANKPQRAVVIGGGNEANARHHFRGEITKEEKRKEVEIRVDENVRGFSMELWTDSFVIAEVAVESPGGERSYFFPIRNGCENEYDYLLEGTNLIVQYELFSERLESERIFFRFKRPFAGVWKVIVEWMEIGVPGGFHIWLPNHEFLDGEVYFLESNPDFTVTEPGSTISGITVGFYNGEDNSVAIPSGRGYTSSMRIKPDFVAPGVEVTGYIGRDRFAERTGSSIATGISAGAAALIMEWIVYRLRETSVVSPQVRDLLILGTRKRPEEVYPNRRWGYGTLDVYNTFETLRRI